MAGLIIALKALASHRLRSILAILGIFLGTLVLTAITHIGSAMLVQADQETRKFGPHLVQVRAGRIRFARTDTATGSGTMSTVTPEDAAAVARAVPQVERLAPYISSTRGIRHGGLKSDGMVMGVTGDYARVRSLELLAGRFVSAGDEDGLNLVCVLGYAIARRLFGNPELAAGRHVFIGGAMLEVAGVLAEKGSDLGGTSFDERVYVPMRAFMRRLTNTDRISGFYMNLFEGSDSAAARAAITAVMRERHKIGPGKRDDFMVFSAEEAARLRNETLELVRGLGVLSAFISFAVGGLGIFSIMILLVRARKMEIGIRRAVGASRRVIIRQFLSEAGLMSGTGGVLGVLLALVFVSLVYELSGMPFVYEPLFCLLAALASVIVGILAGAWPAWQASRVEVLSALKSWE